MKSLDNPDQAPPVPMESSTMNIASIKADILSSLRKDISSVIREELKSALADDFETLKKEIKAVKTEITNNTTAICTEIDHVKANVKNIEEGLSTWSDVVLVQWWSTQLQWQSNRYIPGLHSQSR